MEVEKDDDQTNRKKYISSYLRKVDFQRENIKPGSGCSFLKPPFSRVILNFGAVSQMKMENQQFEDISPVSKNVDVPLSS